MIHKEDDKWVGDFNAFKQTHPDLKSELKKLEGEEIFTRDDVKNLMSVSRQELLSRIYDLELQLSEKIVAIIHFKECISYLESRLKSANEFLEREGYSKF